MRFKARMPVRIHLNGIGHLPLEITVARNPSCMQYLIMVVSLTPISRAIAVTERNGIF